MTEQSDHLNDEYYTTDELANRWKSSREYLANRRSAGLAPSYIKVGSKVLYPVAEVKMYEQNNRRGPTAAAVQESREETSGAPIRDGDE